MLTNANKYHRFVYLSPCFWLVCQDLHEANGHLLTDCRISNRGVMIYGENRGCVGGGGGRGRGGGRPMKLSEMSRSLRAKYATD